MAVPQKIAELIEKIRTEVAVLTDEDTLDDVCSELMDLHFYAEDKYDAHPNRRVVLDELFAGPDNTDVVTLTDEDLEEEETINAGTGIDNAA